ncbi:hypothetical protein ACFLWS_05555 [Chloroflexota bacterium]
MLQRRCNGEDKVIGNEKRASFRGRKGMIIQYESDSCYWVLFDDGRKECVYGGD